jgi:hypothetical protein
MNHPPLSVLVAHCRAKNNIPVFNGDLLCFDPGETTGWCRWECTADMPGMVECGQLQTKEVTQFVDEAYGLILAKRPTFVVYETYRVYKWLFERHAFSDIPTLRMVGALQALLHIEKIPSHGQTAQHPKNFVTDNKLEAWGLKQMHKNRHAGDSIRHGVYWLCFGERGDPNAKPSMEDAENSNG